MSDDREQLEGQNGGAHRLEPGPKPGTEKGAFLDHAGGKYQRQL